MGWTETKSSVPPRIGAGKPPLGRLAANGLAIRIGARDLARLHWRPGLRLTLLVGTGPDHGAIALRPQEGGALEAALRRAPRGQDTLRVVVGAFAGLSQDPDLFAAARLAMTVRGVNAGPATAAFVLPEGWIEPAQAEPAAKR